MRHVGSLQTGRGTLPRLGLSLVPDDDQGRRRRSARRASATRAPRRCRRSRPRACPWFFRETPALPHRRGRRRRDDAARRRTPIRRCCRGRSSTSSCTWRRSRVERPRAADVGAPRRGRRRLEVGVAWVDPPRELLNALSRYLLAGDDDADARGPARRRPRRRWHRAARSPTTTPRRSADYEEILALRLHAHQAEGHLDSASIADLRSPFDAHSRHLTCRFGGRIVGYVRVIFVDGDPARSQYVSLGGHEVPQWLWDAGFVEGGAGATHPDFQRAGLYVPLMQHLFRVAVQSGHRYVLGACPDELLGMYRDMGFEVLEERLVEPKPGWSFRSHLLYADAERLLREPSASRTVAAMASAIDFAGLRAAA